MKTYQIAHTGKSGKITVCCPGPFTANEARIAASKFATDRNVKIAEFCADYKAAASNCRLLDQLGEPYPNLGDCILWGQTAASLAKSTQEALEDACGPMLADMRDWLSDCQWRDEDADSIAEMPAIDIIRAVAKHYSGGLDAFQMATA